MDDFASTAMMRLIAYGLKRQGLAMTVNASDRAHVPLPDKQEMLDLIMRRHGEATVFALGKGLFAMPEEPLLVALRQASDPLDLIDRWQRLERFAHSRHRVNVVHARSDYVCLRHISLRENAIPSRAEDLLVFGVILALLQSLSVNELAFRFNSEAPWLLSAESDGFTTPSTSDIEIRWQPAALSVIEMNRPDQDLLSRVRACLESDPCKRWTVASVSLVNFISGRTLQRRLAEAGTSFNAVLRRARLVRASKLLANSSQSNAQVGYLCGFSDQAHFTREMKRCAAMTPRQFRALASRAQAASIAKAQ